MPNPFADDTDPSRGLWLDSANGRVQLVWHRLKTAADDPPFTRASLAAGLDAGAVMEVDAQLLADNSFICLHDDDLERETTGAGPVDDLTAATAATLRQRGVNGTPLPSPPLMFEELMALAGDARGSGWHLQVDLKAPAHRLTPDAIAAFARAAAPVAGRATVSCGDWPAVQAIAAAVPDIGLGFDPQDLAEAARPVARADFEDLATRTLETAPAAQRLYLWYRLVTQAQHSGCDLIGRFRAAGKQVTVWTIDAHMDNAAPALEIAVAAGASQITTNTPLALWDLWARRPGR